MKNLTHRFCFKKTTYCLLVAVLTVVFTISCSSQGDASAPDKLTELESKALSSITQHFHFDASASSASFTSVKGVSIFINPGTLTLNGHPVTGQIDLEYIEIFDGGSMLVTGRHTMGEMPDGNRSVLLSGGEFYINATKNGQQLALNGIVSFEIPTNLTDGDNGGNPNMTLWNLAENDSAWIPVGVTQTVENGVLLGQASAAGGTAYVAFVNSFGWTNVDCFYEDPRQRSTILVSAPTGYNHLNCAIYLHYDGEGSALALLDKYNPIANLFSEHYGQLPIGLECHIIFVAESNGQWLYAIKPETITAGATYTFTMSETTVGTQAQLTAAINALP